MLSFNLSVSRDASSDVLGSGLSSRSGDEGPEHIGDAVATGTALSSAVTEVCFACGSAHDDRLVG